MPLPYRRALGRAISAAALLGALQAHAQDAAPAAPAEPPVNSAMDAPLFYQLLIGELELNLLRALGYAIE